MLCATCNAQKPDFNLVTGQEINNNSNTVTGVPTPADAVALAVADLGKMTQDIRPFQRYIWIPEPSKAKIGAISYTLNLACSRASTIIKPAILGNGQLIRCDLRSLAPRDGQLNEMIKLWESFQFEPYFHITKSSNSILPVNAVTVEPVLGDPVGSIRFNIDDQQWMKTLDNTFLVWDGNDWIITQAPIQFSKSQVSTYGAHCGLEQSVILQSLTQSNAAIVRYDYFLTKALSTTNGGMYYDFVGIKSNPSGKSAQSAFLESLGANEKLVESLRSDQRAAMFRSNVTGKPRRIDAFYGVGVRPSSGTGLITITYDLSDENVDPRSDPIRNLLDFKDNAREVIAERSNGLHVFALFDNNGGLQDVAPDNIVKDHTVPAPHTARLQPAISCIRCHAASEGFQPFENDVQKMLSGLLDVFGDLDSKSSVPDTLDRLAGLYAGDLSKPLRRARDDYNSAIFRATDGMGATSVGNMVADIYGNYNYNLIDAYTACLELGYDVPEKQAHQYLNQLVPPLNRDSIGISPEDPIIGALKAGLKVNRYQFEQVYADLAFRALQTRKEQNKQSTQK